MPQEFSALLSSHSPCSANLCNEKCCFKYVVAENVSDLGDKLVAERRARLAAERLLELKSRELFAANRKLSEHALALSQELIVHRREAEDANNVAEELRGENNRVRSDLQKATYSLNVAEHRLWLALETIRDGFAIYDADEKLVIANSAYMAVFDGLEEIGPGVHYRDILRIGLEEGVFNPGEESTGDWIEGMLARWRTDTIEPRVIRIWNGSHIRLVDRRGDDGGIVSLALDITEATQREEQLGKAQRKAEAANRAKSAFLANMSHELRTPMNGVVGMAELLAESTLDEEQRLYADTIRSSGEALLTIINDVLDYSKLEAEKLTLHTDQFDLERLVHEVALVLSPTASKKGISLGVDYDIFLPTQLNGDRGRLRQILTNLAGNAVKFTETGHVLIRVTGISEKEGYHNIHIAIEDTGIGIPKEMCDHIFGEFNQVEDDRNRKFEGTGLGLAISRQLVKLMGGDISVVSDTGEGACFTFTIELPVVENPQVTSPPHEPKGNNVLLIESDSLERTILERQLIALGYTVTSVHSIAEIDGQNTPAMIFADAAACSSTDFPPHGMMAPVVFIASSPGLIEGAKDRFAATLLRPFLRQDLLNVLNDVEALPPSAETVAITKPQKDQLVVLAAEDNRTNQLVFSKMVKNLDLDLTFVGNGREAVEAFERMQPDLVFMDISMPEMDGKEATRHIRDYEQKAGLSRTPIVALTAHAMAGDDREILAAGLDKYLTKPLKKAAIYEAIEEFFPGFSDVKTEDTPKASGTSG